jgi:hypothetical protein
MLFTMTDSTTNSLATRSNAVTGLAVVTLILGVLRVVLSALAILFLVFLMTSGLALEGIPRPPHAGRDFGDIDITPLLTALLPVLLVVVAIGIAVAIVSMFAGFLLVIAGVGLWRRRRFSRGLTLVLGVLGGILAFLYAYSLLSALTENTGEFLADPAQAVVLLLGLLVHGGYCAFAFIVLLNRKYAAEFA